MTASESGLEIQTAARLLAEGRASEATSTLEPLVAAAPAYAAALVLLARAYESEGRRGESLSAWHRAHFLVPTSPLIRRERQRLLDAGVEPAPLPEMRPLAEPADNGVDEGHVPPELLSTVDEPEASPMDAVWSDEPVAEAAVSDRSPTEEWTPVSDAHQDTSPAHDEEMAPIDWMTSSDGERPVSGVPGPIDVEPRLFAEDAFAPEVPFEAEPAAAPAEKPEVDEDEGWSVLDETEDRVPDGQERPAEAEVAPPPGYPPLSEWRVVPTPGSRRGRPPLAEEDLDTLIREIEDAPRIKPDPHFVPPANFEVEPTARADEDVVSETLARIYAAQGQFGEAASVYEKLALQRPADAETFRERAAEMRQRASGTD